MTELNSEPPPIAVLVRRGELVESEHGVAYAIAASDGRLLQAAGDVDRPSFRVPPSSRCRRLPWSRAARPSASPSASANSLSPAPRTPASRNTSGWCRRGSRLGLDGSALECGAHPPLHGPSAECLVATGRSPNASTTTAPASTPA